MPRKAAMAAPWLPRSRKQMEQDNNQTLPARVCQA
jgi:hypothetical protein